MIYTHISSYTLVINKAKDLSSMREKGVVIYFILLFYFVS